MVVHIQELLEVDNRVVLEAEQKVKILQQEHQDLNLLLLPLVLLLDMEIPGEMVGHGLILILLIVDWVVEEVVLVVPVLPEILIITKILDLDMVEEVFK